MKHWLIHLDELLRMRALDAGDARDPHPDKSASRRRILWLVLLLGGTYGMFMGWYAVRVHGLPGLQQLVSSTIKMPLLFVFTLAVTFPSLYVFSTLLGSRLSFPQFARIVGEWLAVILAVAASLGPILGFFTLSTESYSFIVFLNVLLLGLAGLIGCAALLRRFRSAMANIISESYEREYPDAAPPILPTPQPPDADVSMRILHIWIVMYGIVGLQMAWVMRPFIGAPGTPFSVFRPTQSHIFEALFRLLLGGLG